MPTDLSTEEPLELKRNGKDDLCIWFLISKPAPIKIDGEKVVSVLAYDLPSAMERAKKEAPGQALFFMGQKTPVKDLLKKLVLGDDPMAKMVKTALEAVEIEPTEVKGRKMGKERFKNSLLLTAETMIKSSEDRKVLEGIVKKL